MKKSLNTLIVMFALICSLSVMSFAQNSVPKFDDELVADFSKGIAGDGASLERAMNKADKILEANPKDFITLAWRGAGLLVKSRESFAAGSMMSAGKLWQSGRQNLDEAVSLAAENIEVLGLRGGVYLSASLSYPFPEVAAELFTLGNSDLEKVLSLTANKADKKSIEIRSKAIKSYIKHYGDKDDKKKVEIYQNMLAENKN